MVDLVFQHQKRRLVNAAKRIGDNGVAIHASPQCVSQAMDDLNDI